MKTRSIIPTRAEQDYRFFFIFMIIIMVIMYFVSIKGNPELQQFWRGTLFTLLLAIHILIHLNVSSLIGTPARKVIYIVGQGALAFVITQMSSNFGMVFTLYMALIGETIGFLRATRWAILTTIFYLGLSLLNFAIFMDMKAAVYWFAASIPTVIFVTLYVVLYNRQAEAREQAQALADELEAANRQLAEYAARVEDLTIANERQRMARELHDTLSQGLAGLILQLEAVDAHLVSNRNDKAQSIIGSAMEQARVTLADARRAIDDLRQPSLDDLDSALRLEMDRFTNATGIPIHFHSDQTPPLPDSTKETLIRALAESLTNIAHHAQAQTVEVNVEVKDNNLILTIKDDGVGFDTSSIPSGHYGILGIKERVRLVNGSFEIQSDNGKGTILKIEAPL